jgi:hypothetical protein
VDGGSTDDDPGVTGDGAAGLAQGAVHV